MQTQNYKKANVEGGHCMPPKAKGGGGGGGGDKPRKPRPTEGAGGDPDQRPTRRKKQTEDPGTVGEETLGETGGGRRKDK